MNLTKKQLLIIGISITIFGILLILIYLLLPSILNDKNTEPNSQNTNSQNNTNTEQQDTQSNSSQVVFTHDILDVNRVDYITPMGDLHGGYDEVSAIAGVMIDLKFPEDGSTPEPMDIYAPTDTSLVTYAYYEMSADEGEEWT